jgi:Zn-finger protein
MKKQIEEMALTLSEGGCGNECDCIQGDKFNCHLLHSASVLYNAGYRKQSENVIEFPCKVGDKAWFVFTPRYPANPSDKGKWFMVEDGVQRLIYGAKGVSIETWNMGTISAREIGKKLFFTKEEAEKVLAKMKGGAE